MEWKSRPIVWNLSRVILINLLYQCICKPVLFKIGLGSATSLFTKGLVLSQLEQCRFAQYPFKVLRPRQRSRHFAVIFLKENCCILIGIVLLEWFPMVQWTFKHSFDKKKSGSAKNSPPSMHQLPLRSWHSKPNAIYSNSLGSQNQTMGHTWKTDIDIKPSRSVYAPKLMPSLHTGFQGEWLRENNYFARVLTSSFPLNPRVLHKERPRSAGHHPLNNPARV